MRSDSSKDLGDIKAMYLLTYLFYFCYIIYLFI